MNRQPVVVTESLYRDEGCRFFPRCLKCPLPVCVEDVPGGAAILRREIRNAEIRRRWRDGEALEVLAECLGPLASCGGARRRALRVGAP